MSNVILDASALLALLNQEPGFKLVERHLPAVVMSAVNVSETMAVLDNLGIPQNEIETLIADLIAETIPFDKKQAYLTALLRKETKQFGLSLGDRACLALAKLKNLPVISADKIWAKLDLGLDIQIIR